MQIQEDKPYDDINITPMLDLAYVLLVIFILMCTASVQGAKVNLPSESKTRSLAKPKTQAISISNEGKITLNQIPISSLDDLSQKLQAICAKMPACPVVIKGDSKTPYQSISDVLDVVGKLGITNVGLATRPPEQQVDPFNKVKQPDANHMAFYDDYPDDEPQGFHRPPPRHPDLCRAAHFLRRMLRDLQAVPRGPAQLLAIARATDRPHLPSPAASSAPAASAAKITAPAATAKDGGTEPGEGRREAAGQGA